MPQNLPIEECEKLGINYASNRMDNGEYRFRLMDNSPNAGWGYILTKMPEGDNGGWQNSHYHKGLQETYIVQKGWIGFAELQPDGSVKMVVCRPGELITTKPGCAHNVFMSSGAITHTIKHGDCSIPNDWFGSQELDDKTKRLTESGIFILAAYSK